MVKTALITGVGGQDGAYLARLLLDKGYRVAGTCRPDSYSDNLAALGIAEDLTLITVDMRDETALIDLIERFSPDEVYNLAAQSSVALSFEDPLGTTRTNALGAVTLMETMRLRAPRARLFQASSADMFGPYQGPRNEHTPFDPKSPYAASKLFAHRMANIYRSAHGLFACCGILFPHESPLRPATFVTRKIILAAVRFMRNIDSEPLLLGNLDARRDWGFAPEYVHAIWMMLQQTTPEDYIIATGESHSVREFAEIAFEEAGFNIEWRGQGVAECGIDRATGRVLVAVDKNFFRPSDIDEILGDPSKTRVALGWQHTTGFRELVRIMFAHDAETPGL